MVSEYTFSGSLPENATTYVTRLADSQLYAGLKAGKFCYVLNSRQMGKSSLRVRTMGRLRREGIKCAAIDLSFDEVQDVKPEQWYVGLIDTLIESFDLDVDLEEFWEKRPLLSALRRFRLFIEEVFNQDWLEQKFNNLRPYSESFRAWVTSKGQDKSRLLLGKSLQDALVWAKSKSLSHQDREFLAASRELEREAEIAEKEKLAELERERKDREAAEERNLVLVAANRKAKRRIVGGSVILGITLLGAIAAISFSAHEVSIAKKDVTEAINEKEEAKEKELEFQKRAVNFQAEAEKHKQQGEGEKAKATLLANQNKQLAEDNQNATEQIEKAKKQQQNLQQEVDKLDSKSQRIKREKQEIENQLEESNTELKENESKSKGLQEQLTKLNNNYRTTQEKLAEAEQELKPMQDYLDKVKELADLAGKLQEEGKDSHARELLSLAGVSAKIEDNYPLKQALLLAGISLAHQQTRQEDLDKARDYLKYSKEKFAKLNNADLKLKQQIKFLTLKIEASLNEKDKNPNKAIEVYSQAFDILNSLKKKGDRKSQTAYISPSFADLEIKILSKETVENFHQDLIKLLSNPNSEQERFDCTEEPQKQTLLCLTKESLKEHYLDELNNYLDNRRWREADRQTGKVMDASAQVKGYSYWYETTELITEFSCRDLKAIDQMWLDYSENNFGFSVQWGIIEPELVKVGLDIREWQEWTQEERGKFDGVYGEFIKQVGWYNDGWRTYQEVMSKVLQESWGVDGRITYYNTGILPIAGIGITYLSFIGTSYTQVPTFSMYRRTVTCRI